MPWLSFTIHKLPLWLPEAWVPIYDALLEIATTIEAHNRDREPDYPFRIKWSPWRVLMWLWHLEEVAVHGQLSYRDPGVQVIAAVKTERTIRAFSYDGDRMCHIPTGETWFGVEVIAAEFAASPSYRQSRLRLPRLSTVHVARPGGLRTKIGSSVPSIRCPMMSSAMRWTSRHYLTPCVT